MKNGDRTNRGRTGIGTVNPMDKGVSAARLPYSASEHMHSLIPRVSGYMHNLIPCVIGR